MGSGSLIISVSFVVYGASDAYNTSVTCSTNWWFSTSVKRTVLSSVSWRTGNTDYFCSIVAFHWTFSNMTRRTRLVTNFSCTVRGFAIFQKYSTQSYQVLNIIRLILQDVRCWKITPTLLEFLTDSGVSSNRWLKLSGLQVSESIHSTAWNWLACFTRQNNIEGLVLITSTSFITACLQCC